MSIINGNGGEETNVRAAAIPDQPAPTIITRSAMGVRETRNTDTRKEMEGMEKRNEYAMGTF